MARTLEPDDFAAMLGRMVAAYFRRVEANGDADDLRAASVTLRSFRRQLRLTTKALHAQGQTADRIADALQISRTALYKQLNLPKE